MVNLCLLSTLTIMIVNRVWKGDTSTQFRGARSNVETLSQVVSPSDIFTTDDVMRISTS